MEFLTRFGISKSRLTLLVMIVLILQGLLSYGTMPKRENPAITIRSAQISAQFPGMSPERMENLIVKPIERKAREIGEVEDINALISTGSTLVTVSIYDHVPKAELNTVFEDIRNKMDDLKPSLPDGTEGPFVNTDYGDVAIATIAVTGEGFSNAELRDSADDLREYLYEIDGISKVSLYGVQEEAHLAGNRQPETRGGRHPAQPGDQRPAGTERDPAGRRDRRRRRQSHPRGEWRPALGRGNRGRAEPRSRGFPDSSASRT